MHVDPDCMNLPVATQRSPHAYMAPIAADAPSTNRAVEEARGVQGHFFLVHGLNQLLVSTRAICHETVGVRAARE